MNDDDFEQMIGPRHCYRLSAMTALEIADRLQSGLMWPILTEAGDMLRSQHAEIERLTAELAKNDPTQLWAEIHTLRCQITGPDGFESWQKAAVHERQLRVKSEAEIKRLTAERDTAIVACIAQLEKRATELDGLSYACSLAAEVLRKEATKMKERIKP